MSTSAISVANEFIRLAKSANKSMTPLQLMKLVYISHGWSLELLKRPLFDDMIEAWKYGPVIPRLYDRIRHYGSSSISGLIVSGFFQREEDLSSDEKELVNWVYSRYGLLNGIQLSALTHKRGTPWFKTFDPEYWNSSISNDLIAEHYRTLANDTNVV